MSVNKAILMGRLGSDPEIRHTPNGTSVVNFSLATSRHVATTSGERQEFTEWHRVVFWGKIADIIAAKIGKGNRCYVEGRIQTRSYQDKSGNTRYMTEVIGEEIEFIDYRDVNNSNNVIQQQPAPQEEQVIQINNEVNYSADDVPF